MKPIIKTTRAYTGGNGSSKKKNFPFKTNWFLEEKDATEKSNRHPQYYDTQQSGDFQ
jgi:hypothetical protein